MPTTPHPAPPTNDTPPLALPPVALPETFVEALNAVSLDPPVPGELWRLEFEGTALPVVVLDVLDNGAELAVAPLGEDPEFADSATVRLPSGATKLGLDTGVWLALERRVPTFVADRTLGPVDGAAWARVEAARIALVRAELQGDGPAIRGPLDPRIEYRAALENPLIDLANAAWSLLADNDEPASFWAYLNDHDVATSRLRQAGFDNPQLTALRGDKLILTPDELSRLAQLVSKPLDEVTQAAPRTPPALVVELHTPHRRAQLQDTGRRHGNPPATERTVAKRQICAAEMRTQGGGEPDWSEALDQWLEQR